MLPETSRGTMPDAVSPERPSTDEIDRSELAADDIFADFVRRANADWVKSVEAVLGEPDPLGGDPDEGEVVLLTQKKSQPPPPAPDAEITVRKSTAEILASAGARARRPAPPPRRATRRAPASEPEWSSVVPERSETTQRVEAARVVPDVASVPPPPVLPQEGSEDGQMPAGELDRKLADMDVLLRYGHSAQVAAELEALRMTYPRDLLLLRRIAELYVVHGMRTPALDALFTLSTELFERRNVEGMRQALEQVRVLDPRNGRAARLLALLARRPDARPAR